MTDPSVTSFQLYFKELRRLIDIVLEGTEAALTLEPAKPFTQRIEHRPDIHTKLAAAVTAGASVRNLIVQRKQHREHDSDESFAQRRRRTSALQDALDGLSLDAIVDTDVRDGLEHFDDRLDRAVIAPRTRVIATDLVITDMRSFSIRPETLRVYVTSEQRYLVGDASVDIAKLARQARAVRARLDELGVSEAGGSIAI